MELKDEESEVKTPTLPESERTLCEVWSRCWCHGLFAS